MSLFVVFEGADGVGKTTLAARVSELLQERGLPVSALREPGATELGERLRDIVKTTPNLTAFQKLLLFSAARDSAINEVILPSLRDGKIVLCDRYILSTHVYQGSAPGVNLVTGYHDNKAHPDLMLLLVEKPEVLRERAAERVANGTADHFDETTDPVQIQELYKAHERHRGNDYAKHCVTIYMDSDLESLAAGVADTIATAYERSKEG